MKAYRKPLRFLCVLFFSIMAVSSLAYVIRSNEWTPFFSGVSVTTSMIMVIYNVIKIELEREIK